MSGGGYFRAARKLFEHEMFAGDEYSRREAWLWMIANAAWQDGPKLKRGEVAVSSRGLAREFGWSRSKVRWFLEDLHSREMVKIHSPHHSPGHNPPPSVVTICNYNKYQDVGKTNSPHHSPHHSPLVKEENTQKKRKKENIRRVEDDHDACFERFWKVFPKRDGDNPKAKARTRFLAITKAGTEAWVLVSAARQCAAKVRKLQTEPRFIPMAITWLNQGRWTDYRPDPDDKPLTDEQRERMFAQLRAVP